MTVVPGSTNRSRAIPAGGSAALRRLVWGTLLLSGMPALAAAETGGYCPTATDGFDPVLPLYADISDVSEWVLHMPGSLLLYGPIIGHDLEWVDGRRYDGREIEAHISNIRFETRVQSVYADPDEGRQFDALLAEVPACLRERAESLGVGYLRAAPSEEGQPSRVRDMVYVGPEPAGGGDAETHRREKGLIVLGDRVFDGSNRDGEDRYSMDIADTHCGYAFDEEPTNELRAGFGALNRAREEVGGKTRRKHALIHEMIHVVTRQNGWGNLRTRGARGEEAPYGTEAWRWGLPGEEAEAPSRYDALKERLKEHLSVLKGTGRRAEDPSLLNPADWRGHGLEAHIAALQQAWDDHYAAFRQAIRERDREAVQNRWPQLIRTRRVLCSQLERRAGLYRDAGFPARWKNDLAASQDWEEYFTVLVELAVRLAEKHGSGWQDALRSRGVSAPEAEFIANWWKHEMGVPLGGCVADGRSVAGTEP